MSALPILGQTVSAKRAIHAYIEHGAHPDQLVRDQAKRAADKAVLRVVRNEPEQPEPCQFCAVEDEAPALFGLVDIWRSEFGAAWPLWIGGWTIFLAAGVVSLARLVWSYFHG